MTSRSTSSSSLQFYLLQLPFWSALVLLVLVALSVLVIRFFVPHLNGIRPDIESWLNQQLPFEVQSSRLEGSLFRIDPALRVRGLELTRNNTPFLRLKDVRLELDTLSSLAAFSPRMKDAQLKGLDIWMQETANGWVLAGWDVPEERSLQTDESDPPVGLRQILAWVEQLLVQGELDFNDLQFHFTSLQGEELVFSAEALNYRRWSGGRQLAFDLGIAAETTQTAQLVITLEGEQFDRKRSRLEAWVNLPLVNLQDFRALWPRHWQAGFETLEGQVSLQAWLNLSQGVANLNLQVNDLSLKLDDKNRASLDEVAISLNGTLEHWSADWQVKQLKADHYQFDQLAGRAQRQTDRYRLQLQELALQPLAQVMQKDTRLPVFLQDLLMDLKPVGHLKNLQLDLPDSGSPDFRAQLVGVGVDDWAGAPLGAGLHGWLQADTTGGRVVFGGHPLRLGFPMLYDQNWDFTDARGQVSWLLENDAIWVIGEQLAVTLPLANTSTPQDIRVAGGFAYQMTADDQRFYLNLGLLSADLSAHHQLVPEKILDDSLHDWLREALQGGQVEQAGFLYAGSIMGGNSATFQFLADFNATDFLYDPRWPPLQKAAGQVLMFDGWVKGQVKEASLYEAGLKNATFATHSKAGTPHIAVHTQLDAGLEFFPKLVQNSPLLDSVPELLHGWGYSGRALGQLKLDIPLVENPENLLVDLQTQVSNGQLNISQLDVKITDINGPLNFAFDQGLESQGLIGQLYGQKTQVKFVTEPESLLEFSTRLSYPMLAETFSLPEAEWISGEFDVFGSMQMNPFRKLNAYTRLQGLQLHPLFPWPKTAEEAVQTHLQLDLEQATLPLTLQAQDWVSFITHLNEPERGMQLLLADQQVRSASLPEQPGLNLGVDLKSINLDQVQAFLAALPAKSITPSGSVASDDPLEGLPELEPLRWLEFNSQQTVWQGRDYGGVTLSLENQPQGLSVLLASDLADGQLWWPKDARQQLELVLGRLHLPAVAAEKRNTPAIQRPLVTKPDPLINFEPSRLPEAYVQVDELKWGDRQLGRWSAELRKQPDAIRINAIQGTLGQTQVSASMEWFYPTASSRLTGQLQGQNIAPALRALTLEASPLVSNRHQLDYDFNWQGSPAAISLSNLAGEFSLSLSEGHFPKSDDRLRGAARFLGLLNMDTLLRRLRLDFSDLTARGVSYERIQGRYQLQNGYLATLQPTEVITSATRISIKGEVDLLEETLDQELVVVLPVAQTLPLAAVLVGAPQVGAGIWVAQKVFGKLFDTFTEARYRMTGPLHDPVIELQRVF